MSECECNCGFECEYEHECMCVNASATDSLKRGYEYECGCEYGCAYEYGCESEGGCDCVCECAIVPSVSVSMRASVSVSSRYPTAALPSGLEARLCTGVVYKPMMFVMVRVRVKSSGYLGFNPRYSCLSPKL